MSSSRWIPLSGAVNVRDLGGLPAADGRTTARNRLIRSDNLQGLTPADVRVLVDEHEVRAVADLRTGVEVAAEGPGPMTREPMVRVVHLSLFPEAGGLTDVAALENDADNDAENDAADDADVDAAADAPVRLPWQERKAAGGRGGANGVYLGYLDDRPDSVVDALRLIANSGGATVVHCAAGKDRTGMITAFALSEVGVAREAIIEDYVLSGERIEAIFSRLRASRTYADDLRDADVDKHRARAETMRLVLEVIDDEHGGVPAWLRAHGWSDIDAKALRGHLLV